VATGGFVELDQFKMGSGVYRYGILIPRQSFRHLYHLDGKTATVDVFLDGMGSMRINTNGKTDATIMMDPERSAGMDEATMTLLAAIPMAIHPQATTAASIGLGSGFTTQILLENPQIRRVDTVEIEQGMAAAAQSFRPMVDLVYTDPRSRIHVDDAKTFFSTHPGKYDLIISEPSNPWVSGVSGLFSGEFYRLIGKHIADDGLFVQWVQLYEINTDLVVSVLKAVAENFSDFAVYAPDDRDILIVARKNGRVPAPDPRLLQNPAIAAALKRIQIRGLQDIAIRKVGDRKTFGNLLASFPIRANSDYYPVLDQNAARTRFLNSSAVELLYFAQMPLPAMKLLSGAAPSGEATAVTPSAFYPPSQSAFTAMALRDFFLSGTFSSAYGGIDDNDRLQAQRLRKLLYDCKSIPDERERLVSLFTTADNVLPYLTPAELERIWRAPEAGPCAASLSVLDKQFVALFSAIGRRDAAGMADGARMLLAQQEGLSPRIAQYVAASGMLGSLMQGKKDEAYQLWTQYKTRMFGATEPNLLFRLLVAESTAP
jgi:spermidine synthase